MSSETFHGVNYGNRFIPEDWMLPDSESIYGDKYGPTVQKPDKIGRISLCDVPDDRILAYLDDVVKEEDFRKMSSWGAKIVRVPMGYWNWLDMRSYSSIS